jgi:hypothetical protein
MYPSIYLLFYLYTIKDTSFELIHGNYLIYNSINFV